MTRVALVLGVVLVACGPQQRVSQCSPSATTGDKPPVLVVLAGESVDVELLLPPAVFCQDGNPVATSVNTEVLNVANASLPHKYTPPTSSDTRGYATVVNFTPSAPGVFYVTARFEPSLGIARRQVQVVASRVSESVALRVPAPNLCDDVVGLEPFALCRRGTELTVLSADAGAVFAESNVLGLVAAERTAWWWTTSAVTRAVTVNGALSRATAPAALGGAAVTSASSEVLARAAGDLLEVRFDGGLSVSSRPMPVPSDVASVCRNGTTYGFGSLSKLCAADDAPDASVRCVDSVGLAPSASEANVMWLRGVETGIVAVARVAQPPLKDPEVLFLDAQAEAMLDTKQPMPAFNWNGRFLSVRRQDLTLEAWLPPVGVMRRAVTEEYVIFQTRDELFLYRR